MGALQLGDAGVRFPKAQQRPAPVEVAKGDFAPAGRGAIGCVHALAVPACGGQIAAELQAIGAVVRHGRDRCLRLGDPAKPEQGGGAGAGVLVRLCGGRLPPTPLGQAEHRRPVLQLHGCEHIERVDRASPRIPHLRASRLLKRAGRFVQGHQIVGRGDAVGIAAGSLVVQPLAHSPLGLVSAGIVSAAILPQQRLAQVDAFRTHGLGRHACRATACHGTQLGAREPDHLLGAAEVDEHRAADRIGRHDRRIERDRPRRLLFRAAPIATLLQQGGPASIGPGAVLRRAVPGQLRIGGHGLVGVAFRSLPDGVAIGLGLGIDRLGRLADQPVQVRLRALEPPAGRIPGAGGDGDSLGSVDNLAGHPRLRPQPFTQIAVQLSEGNAGLGDLHLYVPAPVVGVGRGGAGGHRLPLQGGQAVEQLARHHLSRCAPPAEVGRRGKGRDGDAVVLVRLPGHHRHGPGERHADHDGQHLQERLQAVAEAGPSEA